MKFLIDFFPVLLFFIAFKIAGIYTATAVAIAASLAQLLYARFVLKKIDPLMWVSAAIIVIFGGLTLYLHNPLFIKWKPTILYWFMGSALVVGLAFKRNFIQMMMQEQIRLPAKIWTRLNIAWALFFIFMGALNLYIAYSYSEDTWATFKAFGAIGLIVVFSIAQVAFISRYIEEDQP